MNGKERLFRPRLDPPWPTPGIDNNLLTGTRPRHAPRDGIHSFPSTLRRRRNFGELHRRLRGFLCRMTSAKENRESAKNQHFPAKIGWSRMNRHSPRTAKKIGEANSLAKAILKTTSQPEGAARHWNLRALEKRCRFESFILQPLKPICQQPKGITLEHVNATMPQKSSGTMFHQNRLSHCKQIS